MLDRIGSRGRRLAANGLIALAVATAAGGGVALAGGSGSAQPAPKAGAQVGEVHPGPFVAAVQGLVQDGTIDQSQADAVEAQIRAGSIDAGGLVRGGVVSDSQMSAVAARIDAIKSAGG